MTLKTLLIAMIIVESGGNKDAVGDDGKSFGCLQMTKAYVEDAAKHADEGWTHKDAFDIKTAFKIFNAYIDKYATKDRIGRVITPEDIARIHNGGPNGWKKKSTEKYWEKVKEVMKANKKND